MPKSLDLDRLKKFQPSRTERVKEDTDKTYEPSLERWPSREPSLDGQISIKGPMATIQRFKALCKDDRRTYADMLDILMNHFDGRK